MRLSFLLIAVAALATACERRESPPIDNPLADYSAAARDASPDRRPLGGINVWGYCVSEGFTAVGYRRGAVQGPGLANDNWVCQRGSDQLKPEDWTLVDLVKACRWQYDREDVTARPADPDHAWSWECYAQVATPAPR